MSRLEVIIPSEATPCAECGTEIRAQQFCVMWGDDLLCSHTCAEAYMEKVVGQDYIAAQDQAIASVAATLKLRPRNFILMYETDEEGDPAIGTSIMAHPEFLQACIPVLVEASGMQGTVLPPED